MTWTSFWNTVNEFFQFCFRIIHKLHQVPNILVWVLIIGLLGYWTLQLRKQVKHAKQQGIQP
jgi:hypothetical protein